MEIAEYRGLHFDIPRMSDVGGHVLPIIHKPDLGPSATRLCSFSDVWSVDRYNVKPLIEKVGTVNDKESFEFPAGLRVLDMPIKMPESDIYRFPACVARFSGLIKKIAEMEHATNSYVDECYAYLTIDQGLVEPGATQRNGGAHVDGFQGSRIAEKTLINRSYVVSSCLPTIFYNHGFNLVDLDASKHDFFLEMDLQAQKAEAIQPKALDIMLMNAYTVHEAAVATQKTYRTFFRLSYDVKVFDRLGNTHNPMFDYAWDMVPRDVHGTIERFR